VSLSKSRVCRLEPEQGALGSNNLQEVEDLCRLYSAYAWVAYRAPEYFPSVALAQEMARSASERVDAMLQAQNAASRKRHQHQWRR
jgi:ATP-dependent RNA helicase SUPV3L1/SUV3